MRTCLHLLIACLSSVNLHAQPRWAPTLHIGDPAPPLRLQEWLKGKPFQQPEKGRVYVLEFWATWCAPCRAVMPRLSELARQYRDQVTFLGVNIFENRKPSTAKIKAFVDSMGNRMDYSVAIAEGYLMESGWYDASGRNGIPVTFVVNAEGRIAWIGYPTELEQVLPAILNNTFDIAAESAKRKRNWYLDSLDSEYYYDLIPHRQKEQWDSVLLKIDAFVRIEPGLKFAPHMTWYTLAALFKTDMDKAYAYAREWVETPGNWEHDQQTVTDAIEYLSNEVTITPQLYRLGAELCQKQIDAEQFPELAPMHKRYSRMAEWYSRAHEKSKAIEAQEKAIAALRNSDKFSASQLTAFEAKLQQYRNLQ